MDGRWRDAVLLSEARRRKRIAKMLRQMDRLEGRAARRPAEDRGRRRAATAVGVLVVALGAVSAASLLDDGSSVSAGGLPDRPDDAADAPLGEARAMTTPSDDYAFIETQDGSSEPVTYDPCVPIHVVVDTQHVVDDGMRMLDEAIAEVQDATGLSFVVDGLTDEPADETAVRGSDGGWLPVTVSWSDPDDASDLEGDVAGYAGSASIEDDDHRWFVTGSVVLDGPQLAEILEERGGWASARSVVMHEFAHLVGLDHVDAAGQLMQPEGSDSLTSWGDGDLTGLAALGRGRCIAY